MIDPNLYRRLDEAIEAGEITEQEAREIYREEQSEPPEQQFWR